MGWARRQAARLLKTKWGSNAQGLAEEIFAMMNSEEDFVIDSRTIINPPNVTSPPLVIYSPVDSTGRQVPPIGTGTAGGIVPFVPSIPGVDPFTPPENPGNDSEEPDFPPLTTVGKITGQQSGDMYNCDVWLQPLTEPPEDNVVVKMLNLSPNATLPNGIFIPVVNLTQVLRTADGKISQTIDKFYGFPNVFYTGES